MDNMPKREIKNIFIGADAHKKIADGAEKLYEVVSTTYGAKGHNVILGMPYGDAVLTRDGVTVAKRVILKDKAEDNAASILRQASEKTNRSAGDGTTATVVLGWHLYKNSKLLNRNGMLLKQQLVDDSRKVIDFLKKEAQDASDHLLDVATVSAGDAAIGALVADTLADIGTNGGITIREQSYPTVDVEKIGGYYFDRGFFALNQKVEFNKPLIFVTNKQLASHEDVVPLLSYVISGDNRNLIIIGDVRMNSDAMNTIMRNVLEDKLNAVVVPPPAFNDEGLSFMQDIALYVGAKLVTQGDDLSAVKNPIYYGTAERVVATQDNAIIFKGNGAKEDIEVRVAELTDQLAKEKSSHRKDQLEQRLAKLTGKIAIVNVGGSTPTEMEELRYRVEDAIEATKSAMADGILPGGGTMLIRATKLDISDQFKEALRDSFRKLMSNAAENPEKRLGQIEDAPDGFGFNLRKMTVEPVDLRLEGIFDAARSVIQTVENATSAAGSLLTVNAIVDPVERDDGKVIS